MADLSAYVDFSVRLDKSGASPVTVFADTSAYPVGVVVTSEIFSVIYPSGLKRTGTSGQLALELLLADDDNFQNGLYTFQYVVQATGYDDTTKIKSFPLVYTPVVPVISDFSDVFTPSIKVLDSTLYPVDGFGITSINRTWNGSISYVGSTIQSVTSSAPLLDLAYGGNYYDAHYDTTLSTIVTYTSTTNAWFSIADILGDEYSFDAYTPPALTDLRDSLATMESQIAAGTYCSGCNCGTPDYTPYNTAQSDYNLFASKGKVGETVGIYYYVTQMQMKFKCSGVLNLKHTNDVLPAYSWETVVISSAGVAPLQFVVGSGATYAPVNGATTYVNTSLAYQTALQLGRYNIYDNSSSRFLTNGTDYTKNNNGWSWLGGRTFFNGEGYFMTFY